MLAVAEVLGRRGGSPEYRPVTPGRKTRADVSSNHNLGGWNILLGCRKLLDTATVSPRHRDWSGGNVLDAHCISGGIRKGGLYQNHPSKP